MQHLVDQVDALIDELRNWSEEQTTIRSNAADMERDLDHLRSVTLQRLEDLIQTMGRHVSRQRARTMIPVDTWHAKTS